MSMFGKVAGALGKSLGRAPFVVPTVAFGASLAAPVVEGVGDELYKGGDRLRNAAELLQGEMVQQEARVRRVQRLRRSINENTVRLAQFAPHLYASLMAGQELPEGGTMIGGEPRPDLVQQVAYMMSQGRFQQE